MWAWAVYSVGISATMPTGSKGMMVRGRSAAGGGDCDGGYCGL
jgi:hypothetical protein